MLWAFLLHSAIIFGYSIIGPIFPREFDTADQIAIGIPVGYIILSFVFWMIRYIYEINQLSIIIVVILAYSSSLIINLFYIHEIKFRNFSKTSAIIILLLNALILYLHYYSILYDGFNSRGNVYSDIPFHTSLINSFAIGGNSRSNSLSTFFYSGEALKYPFIPDFWSSIFVKAGASLRMALALPSVFTYVSLFIAIHRIAKNFSRKNFVPEISLIFFIFAGGAGWKWQMIPECFSNMHSSGNHVLCKGSVVFWLNLLLQYLMPQRSAHFSQALDIYIIELIFLFVDGNFRDEKNAFFAGFLMGLLPLISAHSYLAVGLYAIFLCLITFPWKKLRNWIYVIKQWAFFGFTSIIIALPQLYYLFNGNSRKMMSFNPVWNDSKPKDLKNPFSTYWESLSTFVVIALFLAWPTMDKRQILKYLPSLLIFIISSLFRYQPSALDNLKVIFPAWFPYAVCVVSHFFSTMFSISFRKRHFIFILSLFVVVLCFNAVTIYHIYKFMWFKFPIYDIHTKELGLWVAENTRCDAKFLCSGWMTNPITSLAGREVAIGYFGWIWTHGLNVTERVLMMQNMARNPYNYSDFKQKGISYVMYREGDEEREFLWKQPFISSDWVEILDLGGYKLYRLIN